ncbi:MAG: Rieske 2Fe-2S domain-containing protein [Planctomycetota bacterium]
MTEEAESPEAGSEPAAKPVPKKPVAKKPVPAKADADAKSDGEAAAPAVKKAPVKPPAKPAAPAAKAKKGDERRFFLLDILGAAWAMFALATLSMILGVVRFMFPNVLAEPPSQFNTGLAKDQFDPGAVNERWKTDFQVWIVNLSSEQKLVALSTVCTHLGCTPSWLEQEQKFKCPCHGSGFYKDGINFEGPAPRPLERFAIYEVDGVVVVDKSKKFQFELGQWDDPQSFVRV